MLLLPNLDCPVFSMVTRTLFRKLELPQGSTELMSSLEFVNLEPFNSIPFVQLTGDQTAAMIKVAAKPPPERMAQSKLIPYVGLTRADDSHGLAIEAQVRSSPQGQVLEYRDQHRHDEG